MEARKLRKYWDAMEHSPYFGKFMLAAEERGYKMLGKISKLYVYF